MLRYIVSSGSIPDGNAVTVTIPDKREHFLNKVSLVPLSVEKNSWYASVLQGPSHSDSIIAALSGVLPSVEMQKGLQVKDLSLYIKNNTGAAAEFYIMIDYSEKLSNAKYVR